MLDGLLEKRKRLEWGEKKKQEGKNLASRLHFFSFLRETVSSQAGFFKLWEWIAVGERVEGEVGGSIEVWGGHYDFPICWGKAEKAGPAKTASCPQGCQNRIVIEWKLCLNWTRQFTGCWNKFQSSSLPRVLVVRKNMKTFVWTEINRFHLPWRPTKTPAIHSGEEGRKRSVN